MDDLIALHNPYRRDYKENTDSIRSGETKVLLDKLVSPEFENALQKINEVSDRHKDSSSNSTSSSYDYLVPVLEAVYMYKGNPEDLDKAKKALSEYWRDKSANYELWRQADKNLYVEYLTDKLEKTRQKKNEFKNSIKVLEGQLETIHGSEGGVIRDADEAAVAAAREIADLEQRLQKKEGELAETKKQLDIKSMEVESCENVNFELSGELAKLVMAVDELADCQEESDEIKRRLVTMMRRVDELMEQNLNLVRMAQYAHLKQKQTEEKLLKVNEELVQCRNPDKIKGLFHEVIMSNKAIYNLWRQMKMLKKVNSVSEFHQDVLKNLIIAAGALRHKPEALVKLNNECPTCPETAAAALPKCGNCEFMEKFALKLVDTMFSCGIVDGPTAASMSSKITSSSSYQQQAQQQQLLPDIPQSRFGLLGNYGGGVEEVPLDLLDKEDAAPVAAAAAPNQQQQQQLNVPPLEEVLQNI